RSRWSHFFAPPPAFLPGPQSPCPEPASRPCSRPWASPGYARHPDGLIDSRPSLPRTHARAACARNEQFLPCVCVQRTWKYSLGGVTKKRRNLQPPHSTATWLEQTNKFSGKANKSPQ